MLSFLVALLQIDPQEHRNEAQLQARAKEIFALADTDHDGEMSIQEIYNYFADVRVCPRCVAESHTTVTLCIALNRL